MNHIITISREYGSGGHELATRLSEKLGIPFYDREIIRMAAEKSGISMELVEETGEYKTMSWALNAAMPNIYTGNVMDMLPPADRVYIVQQDLIRQIAAKGDCVMIGRCADYILRDRNDVLKIFVTAPSDVKMKRVALRHPDLDEKGLKKRMEKIDRQRAAHNRHYTDREWGAAKNYDLCLNSGTLGLDACVELAVKAFQS